MEKKVYSTENGFASKLVSLASGQTVRVRARNFASFKRLLALGDTPCKLFKSGKDYTLEPQDHSEPVFGFNLVEEEA